jgi:hypothetical protein
VTSETWLVIPALLLAGLTDAGKVELKPPTMQAFERYIQATEAKLDQRVNTPAFLWVDGDGARRSAVQRGEVVCEPVSAKGDIDVPDGLVHDWVGGMFVREATLEKVIAMFENYDNAKNIYKPEVIDSKTLARDGNRFKVYMRLLKKQVVTVVLNTTHDVQYVPVDGTRWYSKSYSSRIAEVENAGKTTERELPPGQDHGFLWRLNSYWRFEERDGGVYVECQAVSLTRNVPTGLGWLINPIIRSLPRQSLENTLRSAQKAAMKIR